MLLSAVHLQRGPLKSYISSPLPNASKASDSSAGSGPRIANPDWPSSWNSGHYVKQKNLERTTVPFVGKRKAAFESQGGVCSKYSYDLVFESHPCDSPSGRNPYSHLNK